MKHNTRVTLHKAYAMILSKLFLSLFLYYHLGVLFDAISACLSVCVLYYSLYMDFVV